MIRVFRVDWQPVYFLSAAIGEICSKVPWLSAEGYWCAGFTT